MDIVFKYKYVDYSQISDVSLLEINDVLIKNDISLELNDNFCNDWAGYSYYYCKLLNYFDEETISSFVYIITWFMTNNPVDINPNFKSNTFYKNSQIITACLKIYNNICDNYDSEIELCKELFNKIYSFYMNHRKKYVRRDNKINFLLSYEEVNLLDKIDGKNRSEKLRVLLNNYYDFY